MIVGIATKVMRVVNEDAGRSLTAARRDRPQALKLCRASQMRFSWSVQSTASQQLNQ